MIFKIYKGYIIQANVHDSNKRISFTYDSMDKLVIKLRLASYLDEVNKISKGSSEIYLSSFKIIQGSYMLPSTGDPNKNTKFLFENGKLTELGKIN
ncbi:hypothetical protein ACSXC4_15595 (plasmid) [Clostridium perfringens]|uniref:Uncharacterized protein n=1 Tax=Clostridium perfringens TaxID=1502 RepID=A0A140GQ32_CLOPF|nr:MULTISPECIES: hypothetical protein [Clostridium]AMN30641.1 hypothetical protein JFP838_pC0059 [Clostridium perfringens]AMN30723.1 hypothetical protein JFP55_pF0059 [Clostridium perfringens]MDK7591274.1 hypothetical protein [Clostridium sp. UMB9555B]MDK7629609.1 hypothetical protein [Clostridium sp. UMB9555A]